MLVTSFGRRDSRNDAHVLLPSFTESVAVSLQPRALPAGVQHYSACHFSGGGVIWHPSPGFASDRQYRTMHGFADGF